MWCRYLFSPIWTVQSCIMIEACSLDRLWTSVIHFFEGVDMSMLHIYLQCGEVFQWWAQSCLILDFNSYCNAETFAGSGFLKNAGRSLVRLDLPFAASLVSVSAFSFEILVTWDPLYPHLYYSSWFHLQMVAFALSLLELSYPGNLAKSNSKDLQSSLVSTLELCSNKSLYQENDILLIY